MSLSDRPPRRKPEPNSACRGRHRAAVLPQNKNGRQVLPTRSPIRAFNNQEVVCRRCGRIRSHRSTISPTLQPLGRLVFMPTVASPQASVSVRSRPPNPNGASSSPKTSNARHTNPATHPTTHFPSPTHHEKPTPPGPKYCAQNPRPKPRKIRDPRNTPKRTTPPVPVH